MKIAVIVRKGCLPNKVVSSTTAKNSTRIVKQATVWIYLPALHTDSTYCIVITFKASRLSPALLKVKGLDALLSSAIGGLASSRRHYDIVHFHALSSLAGYQELPLLQGCCHLPRPRLRRTKWEQSFISPAHLGEHCRTLCHKLIVVSEELRSYFMRTYASLHPQCSVAPW